MLTYKSPCCRRCCLTVAEARIRELETRSRIITWAAPLLLHSKSSLVNLNQCSCVMCITRAVRHLASEPYVCLMNKRQEGSLNDSESEFNGTGRASLSSFAHWAQGEEQGLMSMVSMAQSRRALFDLLHYLLDCWIYACLFGFLFCLHVIYKSTNQRLAHTWQCILTWRVYIFISDILYICIYYIQAHLIIHKCTLCI